jgi:thienamycin biosynthesis protein ThnN
MEPESHRILRESVFPGVPVVGMYGTSTTSISWQKPYEPADEHRVVYVPSSPYVLLDVIDDDDGRDVAFGEEGRVRVWRLTDDQLIPGFLERDRARRVRPYGSAAEQFPWPWIGDPYSPEFTVLGRVEGVY